MPVRLTRFLAAVILVAFAVAGCESGGYSGQEPLPDMEPEPSVSTSTVPSGGFAGTVIAWHWQVEEETARCMAERGFDYVPYVPQVTIDNLRGMYDENRIEVKPDVDEYWAPLLPMESSPVSVNDEEMLLEMARRTGFDIFFELESFGQPPEDDLTADPNGAIAQALGDEELAEYHRALYGYAAGDLDGVNEPSEEAMENACTEVARRNAGAEPLPPARLEGVDIERLSILGDKVFQLVQADPRLEAAKTERVACLADQGLPPYPYEYILGLLRSETERVTGDPQGAIENTGDKETDFARAFGADRLRELRAEELAAAIAGNECAMPYTRVIRELINEYERQILAENPDIAALLNQDN